MNEEDRLREIAFYKGAIFSLEDNIRLEKEGLILDSGTRLPHVVNTATIREYEDKIAERRKIIAELLLLG